MSVRRIAQEREWKIDGLRISGLSWGDSALPTIIALHGWLDNAASFWKLAPLLENYQVIAIDLPGHGLTDDRSPDATYQIWDDLPQLVKLIEDVSSLPIVLMGHSRGAIISLFLAAVLSEKVRSMVALDALIPDPQPEGNVTNQLKKFIKERQNLVNKKHTYLRNREDVIRRRCSVGLSLDAAEILARRSLLHVEDKGYFWRFDQRLKGASAVKFSKDDLSDILGNIEIPVMLAIASDGYANSSSELDAISQTLTRCEIVRVKGGHHFHMEESAQYLSQIIDDFLAR
tara:strand:+ start:347 stop:1207 length:861 start_codon:yes stop_codon:yes gene_type:complete